MQNDLSDPVLELLDDRNPVFWRRLRHDLAGAGGGAGPRLAHRERIPEFYCGVGVHPGAAGREHGHLHRFVAGRAAGGTGGYAGRGAAVLCHHPAGGGGAAQRAPVRRGTGSAGRGAPLCGGHDPGHGGHDGPFHAGRLYGRPGGRLCTGRPGHCGVCAAGAGALRVQKNTAESTIPHWDDPAFCRTGHRVLALRRAQPSGCCFSSCRMARNCSGTLSSGISRSTSTVPAACAVS